MNDIINNTNMVKLIKPSIYKKTNKYGEEYYIIVDNKTNCSYLCFAGEIKEKGWLKLSENKEIFEEINFEYSKNEKGNNIVKIIF